MINPALVTLLILDLLAVVYGAYAGLWSYRIFRTFNPELTTAYQYDLERRTYLVSSIIQILLAIKVIVFPLFIYSLDQLAFHIPGAMCAVGVINASKLGVPLLLIKLLGLFLFSSWILIHNLDLKKINFLYTLKKHGYFLLVYGFLLLEVFVQYTYLLDLDLDRVVACCSTIFQGGQNLTGVLSSIPLNIFLPVFIVIYLLTVISQFWGNSVSTALINLIFLGLGLMAILVLYSPYIYELPSHQCPFCILQKEYNYIGFLLYPLLLLGTFAGIAPGFLKVVFGAKMELRRIAIVATLSFVLLASWFPLAYYFSRGTWL